MAATYVTIKGLAEHFSVSVSLVRTWLKRGLIPPTAYLKLHGTYRFDLDKVEAALCAASETDTVEQAADEAEELSIMENDND